MLVFSLPPEAEQALRAWLAPGSATLPTSAGAAVAIFVSGLLARATGRRHHRWHLDRDARALHQHGVLAGRPHVLGVPQRVAVELRDAATRRQVDVRQLVGWIVLDTLGLPVGAPTSPDQPPPAPPHPGREIRARREALGWSQYMLARGAGVPRHQIAELELERRDYPDAAGLLVAHLDAAEAGVEAAAEERQEP